ncbi:hypothetical protein DPV73_10845 [Leptospira mayottensis]|nr:hypothetical protein DPV73_10845 [Leptospira mayottensis]
MLVETIQNKTDFVGKSVINALIYLFKTAISQKIRSHFSEMLPCFYFLITIFSENTNTICRLAF